jgi:hypothetical protein
VIANVAEFEALHFDLESEGAAPNA